MKITHTEDYRTLRQKQMPDIGDQMDDLWKIVEMLAAANPLIKKALTDSLTFQHIKEVKARIPKPLVGA